MKTEIKEALEKKLGEYTAEWHIAVAKDNQIIKDFERLIDAELRGECLSEIITKESVEVLNKIVGFMTRRAFVLNELHGLNEAISHTKSLLQNS